MLGIALFTVLVATPPSAGTEVTALAIDGVTIHGDMHFRGVAVDAPLVLLFHQAGGDARGEYGPVVPWLNEAGFRVIAWDGRSGGDRFGGENRTVGNLPEGVATGYCDAYADLVAALDHSIDRGLADRVVVWGSSYSAALVVRLAAEHPEKVAGVLAFSPATGGVMMDCEPRMWIDAVRCPVFAFRPDSEMDSEVIEAQREAFTAAGARFMVVEHGVHGSSMLVDERTDHDMGAVREAVLDWLAHDVEW